MKRQVQRFEVSLKAFIVREERVLVAREAETGWWELPGGRIDVGEEREAHARVLAREIGEELGPDLAIAVGEGAVTWVRRRAADGVFTFLVGRVCRIVSGAITLSSEHMALDWATAEDCKRLEWPPESGYPDAIAALWRLAGTQG